MKTSHALMAIGAAIFALGAVWEASDRFPALKRATSLFGRLPGDVVVERDGFRLYAPLATSLLVSLALSFVAWLLARSGR